ncbi:MAG: YtxH domain-containing protein [Solibacillus sp.]|uniref:YtxH domain-containing protein n=1 Tax=unclassified Solibacillus TaxID=2637870 RepID=UPI0030FC270A
MNAKTFILGLTTGLISGAAVVLFSAPQSGAQLRQNILSNSVNAKSKLQEIKSEIQNVSYSVTALKSEAQNNIPTIINDLKDTFSNFTEEIQPQTARLKQEIEGLQNSISEIEKNIPSDKNNI